MPARLERRAGSRRRRTRCRTWPPTPFGLLDHLGIERAHVLGASMGGMIAQTMAIEHPERCLSLISVMSSPGDPRAGQADARGAGGAASATADRARRLHRHRRPHRACARRRSTSTSTSLAPGRPAAYDRAFYPEGAPTPARRDLRQRRPHRRAGQGRGPDARHPRARRHPDHADGGTLTAEAIPEASLLLLAHMGHDLPEPLWPMIVDAVISHTSHADDERLRKDHRCPDH